jgi:hypothetical protein
MTNDQMIHNQELIRRSQELSRKANAVAATILAELLNLRDEDPDALRQVLSSVNFRNLEIYESYRKQEDAVMEDWIHDSAVEAVNN